MEKLGATDPQRVGAYRLLRRLGAGGMGQVFLARSDRGRTVAIKLVRPDLAEQQEFRDRFRQEVQAARRVGGNWTAPVLDADIDAAVPWVATGYVAGPSLHRIVSGRAGAPVAASDAYGPLPERTVRILGTGLAHALQDIHRAGLIHRDLKPSNVLMTIDGPRVIDFGIARALDTATDGGLTRTGALIGSPGFMSPEQVRGERVTTACDVFCLGSVLAYAATGRQPFGAADSGAHALLFRIAQEEPDLTGVPADLVGLIRDCLDKDPDARPSTDAILERLGSAESGEPWLPVALIAQLGRHAVGLLDAEDPEEQPPAGPEPVTAALPVPALPTIVGPPPLPSAPPQLAPPTGGRRSAIALGVVAVLVAIGAAGSVVTYMRHNDDGHTTTSPTASPPPTASPSPTRSAPDNKPSPAQDTDASDEGAVPAGYLGFWYGTIDNGSGLSTRELLIEQGEVGDTVLSLTADGPLDTGGTYHCVFQAALDEEPSEGSPVRIGPSTVAVGEPPGSCSPGRATLLTLLPDGTLRRETADTGEQLTYTKTG